MIFREERELVMEYDRKLIESNLTKGTEGNISIFIRDKKLMAISPSGIDYFKIKPKDILIMDLNGNVVDGSQKPSSEYLCTKYFMKKEKILMQ